MRLRILLGCVASAMFFCAPAHAAGSGAAAATSFTWTGSYIGVDMGYGWGNSRWDFDDGSGSNSRTINTSSRFLANAMVGAQGGYNMQLSGNLVAGIEASIATSNMEGDSSCPNRSFSCRTKIDFLSDLSGRLGLSSGNSLLFLKGGVAYENSRHTFTNATTGAVLEDKGGNVGYLIGAGAEYAFTYNIIGKIEYNYDYFPSTTATFSPANRITDNLSANIIKAGVSLKFN